MLQSRVVGLGVVASHWISMLSSNGVEGPGLPAAVDLRFFIFGGIPEPLVEGVIAPPSSAALRLLPCDPIGLPARLPEGLIGLAERLFCPRGLLPRPPFAPLILGALGLVAR